MERTLGIEPRSRGWKPPTLPLSYARFGGRWRTRTSDAGACCRLATGRLSSRPTFRGDPTRKRMDSNHRDDSSPSTRFPSERLQPLGHASVGKLMGKLVDSRGFEPRLPTSHAGVFPLDDEPMAAAEGIDPSSDGLEPSVLPLN